MSEDITPIVPSEIPKSKLYLLVIGQQDLGILSTIIPCIKFIEIEGMGITDNSKMQVLVTPLSEIVNND